ncbi:aldo/keto reductase [Candidatus Woesearchaeota archaeon]|nr:aldo/keto reductase [Candidatus Woesearchaeota archaeon]
MEYKTVGEITLPTIGIGTGGMGPHYSQDLVRDQMRKSALHAAIEHGVTHIDTAERYGGGRSEEILGEVIRHYERSTLFITTKVLPQNLSYSAVLSAAEGSAKRLGTHIDLYLIHKPNPGIPLEETMAAFDRLVADGLVRSIGVSNFSIPQLEEAQRYSTNQIIANQIEYSLLARNTADECQDMESETVPYCQKKGLFIISYKPLRWGQLAKVGHPLIDQVAKKYGKTPAQVSLNWLISQKNVVTITKMTNPRNLQDNLGALGWRLEQADWQLLQRELGDASIRHI